MDAQNFQRTLYETFMQSQFWHPDRMAEYQQQNLSLLLMHARDNVPFYADRLSMLFRPGGDIDFDRWYDVPIVTRRDMIEHRQAMQARRLPVGHGPVSPIKTSGSTGLPIEITVNALTAVVNNGLRWRVQRWHDMDWSQILYSRLGDSAHLQKFPHGEKQGLWGPPWDVTARRGYTWRVSRDLPSEQFFELYEKSGAVYMNAGPNMAHINAVDAMRLGIRPNIRSILVQGNVVRPADRAACMQAFGAPLIELYSSKEAGQMAHPCPEGRMHVNMENCLLEVIGDDGRPCGPGQTGRVIVTPFFQTAQPVIRYDQGDRVTVGEPCSCGRHSTTFESISGRYVAIFRHPSGKMIALLMPTETSTLLDCHYWQLAQVGPNDYEFRYVPIDWNRPADEPAVEALFRKVYFDDAQVRFSRMETLPVTAGGKIAEYVCEWQPLN